MNLKSEKIKIFFINTMIPALVGFFLAYYGISSLNKEGIKFSILLILGLGLPLFFLSVLIHELGHLVFGLATGFKFFSFQFLNLLFYKEKDHIKFTFSRAAFQNALGQCILYNQDFPKSDKKPFFWYNIGGLLFNFILFLLGILLILLTSGLSAYTGWFLMLINAFLFVTNGIPQSSDQILNNDGNTIKLCRRSEAELLGFYASINTHQKLSEGIDLRDLEFTHTAPIETAHIFSLATYLLELDQELADLNYASAKDLGQKLLKNPNVKGLYKNTVLSELLFIELMLDSPKEVIDQFETKKLFAFPSETALRVQYAYGKYAGYQEKKLEKIKKKFYKQVQQTPQKGIVASATLLFQEAERIQNPMMQNTNNML